MKGANEQNEWWNRHDDKWLTSQLVDGRRMYKFSFPDPVKVKIKEINIEVGPPYATQK